MTSLQPEPQDYGEVLERLKHEVRAARARAQRVINTQLLELYWVIGRTILERQRHEGWGSAVINRLSEDLQTEFPDMKGLGRSNLEYMRRFAAAWPGENFPQQPVGEIPWGHIVVLLDRVQDPQLRDWYAERDVENGWSRSLLVHQIKTKLHKRLGAAPSNLDQRLQPADAQRAQEILKDPYVFDFLALGETASERDIEKALQDKIQQTLLELGRGFAFVGRQVHFDVDGQDFFVDMLFFHVEQMRYLVVELKVGEFRPENAGQLNFYVALVDDKLRKQAIHAPTVGLLLCAGRSDAVVRYSLANTTAPLAVADYVLSMDDLATQPTRDGVAGLGLPEPSELEGLVESAIAEVTRKGATAPAD